MITAVIIAKNEEFNLPDCISCLNFCSRILVLDNNSSDKSVAIAKKMGADVINAEQTDDFSKLRNFALTHVTTPWTLYIDADERVSSNLAKEITSAVMDSDIDGIYLHRLDHLWGKSLTHGDTGKIWLLRLGRTQLGKWTGRVHETWQISDRTRKLIHPLNHYPHPDLSSFLQKLNLYSSIRAKELRELGTDSNISFIIAYPLAKFFHLWFVKLGILDGTAGFIHAMSMSFYSFLVRGKLYLLSKGVGDKNA